MVADKMMLGRLPVESVTSARQQRAAAMMAVLQLVDQRPDNPMQPRPPGNQTRDRIDGPDNHKASPGNSQGQHRSGSAHVVRAAIKGGEIRVKGLRFNGLRYNGPQSRFGRNDVALTAPSFLKCVDSGRVRP